MTLRRRFAAVPLVLRWTIAGAVLPTVLWLAVVLVAAVVGTVLGVIDGGLLGSLEIGVQAISYVVVMVVLVGVPGAVVGLGVGLVDRVLGRRVERHGGSRRSVVVADLVMAGCLLVCAVLLQLALGSGTALPVWFVAAAVLAAGPVVVCDRRYRRIAAASPRTTGSGSWTPSTPG